MNKSGSHSGTTAHRQVQRSATLNRKYVKRPVAQTQAKASQLPSAELKRRQEIADRINRENLAAIRKGYVAAPKAQDSAVPVTIAAKAQATQAQAQKSPAATQAAKATAAAQAAKATAAAQAAKAPAAAQAAKAQATPDIPAQTHPLQASAIRKMQDMKQAQQPKPQLSPKELKDRAIKQALRSVATMDEDYEQPQQTAKVKKHIFKPAKVILAFGCAAIIVAFLAIAVSYNMPYIKKEVAAMQTGIDASAPSYIPSGYALSDITSQDGKIVMTFNGPESAYFEITEEKSSWDSAALKTNYAQKTWGTEFDTIREQGLTLYIHNSDAAWVNGGLVYKIVSHGTNFTKSQIRKIATSL